MSTLTDRGTPGATNHVDEAERVLVDALVPPQRSRRWGWLISVAAGAVVAGVAFATLSGTVVPRITAITDNWGSTVRGGPVHFTFKLHNDGLRPATITAIDLGAAGLEHGRLDVHLPVHLAAHHDVAITATFTGLRCDRIDPRQFESGIRLTARGDLPFANTVTASVLTHFSDEFVGTRTYSGSDPLQIGWPAGITQNACAHP